MRELRWRATADSICRTGRNLRNLNQWRISDPISQRVLKSTGRRSSSSGLSWNGLGDVGVVVMGGKRACCILLASYAKIAECTSQRSGLCPALPSSAFPYPYS